MTNLELTRHLGGMISDDESLARHPAWPLLSVVLGGETSVSTAGFPYISDSSFRLAADRIPHLFVDAAGLLAWLEEFEQCLERAGGLSEEDRTSVGRATKVLRNMVLTAAITAPPDLWVLRQVLAAHRRMGVLSEIESGEVFSAASLAAGLELNEGQLAIDIHLLHARGYLEQAEDGFVITGRESVVDSLRSVGDLAPEFRGDWVPEMVAWLDPSAESEADVESFLQPPAAAVGTGTWIASASQLELGFRLVPLVLGLRVTGRTESMTRGSELETTLGERSAAAVPLLEACGLAEAGKVTALGARVFARGPGPFGIIGAYHPYFAELDELLRPGGHEVWVRRRATVARA